MTTPHIALLRRSGRFLLAAVRTGADRRLWATAADGKPFRYSPQQLLWETALSVPDADLPAWLAEAERLANGVDVAEAWEVVVGETPGLSLQDLAELALPSPPQPVEQAAVLLRLFTDDVQRFTPDPPYLRPRDRDDVARQAQRRQERQRSAEEEAQFADWLAGGAPERELTPAQRGWLDAVVAFAVHGDESQTARAAKGWLRPLGPAPDPRQLAFGLLVQRGVFHPDEFLTLRRLRVRTSFPPDALAEAEVAPAADPRDDPARRDLTHLNVFTIDEPTTVDIDDGLSAAASSEGGYDVGVHIVDAAALVPAGGALDDAARERLTTLYLPETTLPMLPRALSEGRGSMAADTVRCAVSLLTHWDADGALQSWEICRSTVRSRRRFSYAEADAALESTDDPYAAPLRALHDVAQALRAARLDAGALDLDRPEVKVSVDASGAVDVSVTPSPTPSRRMVGELMVLANRLFGAWLRDRGVPAIYRTQEPVAMDDVPDTTVAAVRQYHILRRIRPSRLTTSPGPHALMGVEPYVQATSPLRRYLDLAVQRQLAAALDGATPPCDAPTMQALAGEASAMLGDLGRAEDERKRYWLLKHLATRLGESFPAVVLDVRDRRSVVELEGCLLRSNVYLLPDVAAGQTVSLELQEVDTWRGQARFRQAE